MNLLCMLVSRDKPLQVTVLPGGVAAEAWQLDDVVSDGGAGVAPRLGGQQIVEQVLVFAAVSGCCAVHRWLSWLGRSCCGQVRRLSPAACDRDRAIRPGSTLANNWSVKTPAFVRPALLAMSAAEYVLLVAQK
jgi:hypothetical protein